MSNFGNLNWADLGKGLLIAFGTVVLGGLAPIVSGGILPDGSTFVGLCVTGFGAALTYLLKNLFTNSKNELGKSEPS